MNFFRDSFDATNKIKSIRPEAFDDSYICASFDVESLFMNVPLQKTINKFQNNKLFTKNIFTKKHLATQLKKETLKKLLIDSWSKTVFSTNNKLYQQVLVWVAPLVHFLQTLFPARNYMFKFNNRTTPLTLFWCLYC